MPIEYQIYDNGKYVYAKATGILTPEEIINYEKELKSNPELEENYKEIFDVRFITETKVTIKSFAKIIQEVKSNKKRTFRSKLAIITSKPDSFDKAKYFEKTIPPEKQDVIVFNTLETAKTWLGVDKP